MWDAQKVRAPQRYVSHRRGGRPNAQRPAPVRGWARVQLHLPAGQGLSAALAGRALADLPGTTDFGQSRSGAAALCGHAGSGVRDNSGYV